MDITILDIENMLTIIQAQAEIFTKIWGKTPKTLFLNEELLTNMARTTRLWEHPAMRTTIPMTTPLVERISLPAGVLELVRTNREKLWRLE